MTAGSRGFISFRSRQTHVYYFVSALLVPVFLTVSTAQQSTELPDAPNPQLIAQASAPSTDQPMSAAKPAVTIPAGTRLSLALTRPVDTKITHHGDQISAQLTDPVVIGNQVAVPGGTYVQGKVDRLTRRGTRAEMVLQSASLVFPNGYVADAGPLMIESDQWTAWSNPSGGAKVGIFAAPIASSALGLLIGHAADTSHTMTLGGGSMPSGGIGGLPGPFQPVPQLTVTTNSHKGLVIGGAVGGAVGMVASLVLVARSRGFYITEGSPLETKLEQAVTLTQTQIDDANQKAATQPPPAPVRRQPLPGQWPGTVNAPLGLPVGPPSGPASCSAGQEWCQGECKGPGNFISDDLNCGRCMHSCGIGEACFGGSCSCAAGYSSCMGQCVSDSRFISDHNNCGSCGHSCSIGESCMGGSCM